MLVIRSYGITDVGLLRTHNGDCFETDDLNQVYIVADGMGGHNHGEVASRVAVDSIREFIAQSVDRDGLGLPRGDDVLIPVNHRARLERVAPRLAFVSGAFGGVSSERHAHRWTRL